MTCYELPKSKGTSKIFLDTKYIRLIQKPHTLAALSRQNKPTPRGTMAVHLKNNTRVGEEEGAVLTDVTNQKAVATIATFIRAPRDHPLSAGSPVSFWSNCFIQANPKTGQLLELVLRNCDLTADLTDLAPALAKLPVLEWLDLSENSGLSGDLSSLILSEDNASASGGNGDEGVGFGDIQRHGTDYEATQERAEPERKEAATSAKSIQSFAPKSSRNRGQSSGLAGCLQGLDLHETFAGGLLGAAAQLKALRWLDVRSTQCRGTLDALVPATDAGVLRYLDVRHCCDIEGPLPARFEQAVQLQVFYAGTELEPEDLVGTGKVMPGGYWPPSHHIHRPDKKTLSVW